MLVYFTQAGLLTRRDGALAVSDQSLTQLANILLSPHGVVAKSSLVFELPAKALEEGVDLDDAVAVNLLQGTLQHLLEDLVQCLFR